MGQQATLIMETYGFSPVTKASADCHVWSRLYRAENIFIDISLATQNQEITLSGQIIEQGEKQKSSGNISLLDGDKQHMTQTAFMDREAFYLSLTHKGSFDLRIEFEDTTIVIPLAIA